MRLLHTSDWHLGRSFHGASLLEEQSEALDRIVELAREAAVDVVVIAGDLYDRAIPPAEAVSLFTETLARLRRHGIAVVAIAGNHDSHVRVSVYDPLLNDLGVTIRGAVTRATEPVLVEPRRGGAPVALYPLPYLEPVVDGPRLLAGLGEERAKNEGGRRGKRSPRPGPLRRPRTPRSPCRASARNPPPGWPWQESTATANTGRASARCWWPTPSWPAA